MLKASGLLPDSHIGDTAAVGTPSRSPFTPKPPLSIEELVGGGFELSSRWILSDSGDLTVDRQLPQAAGVYAFAKDESVVYIGVATMGLAKRLYSYSKPGETQRTSQRFNGILKNELLNIPFIEIFTATPAVLGWNELPVHGIAGLELGLIRKFALPWNIRSAN